MAAVDLRRGCGVWGARIPAPGSLSARCITIEGGGETSRGLRDVFLGQDRPVARRGKLKRRALRSLANVAGRSDLGRQNRHGGNKQRGKERSIIIRTIFRRLPWDQCDMQDPTRVEHVSGRGPSRPDPGPDNLLVSLGLRIPSPHRSKRPQGPGSPKIRRCKSRHPGPQHPQSRQRAA